jgi:hypothetical protein
LVVVEFEGVGLLINDGADVLQFPADAWVVAVCDVNIINKLIIF